MRAIICIAALLLVCLKVKVVDTMYKCSRNQLVDCDNNNRLNIAKSNHFYYLSIPMCSNEQCATNVPEIVDGIQWIHCNDICRYCNKLLMAVGQG